MIADFFKSFIKKVTAASFIVLGIFTLSFKDSDTDNSPMEGSDDLAFDELFIINTALADVPSSDSGLGGNSSCSGGCCGSGSAGGSDADGGP